MIHWPHIFLLFVKWSTIDLKADTTTLRRLNSLTLCKPLIARYSNVRPSYHKTPFKGVLCKKHRFKAENRVSNCDLLPNNALFTSAEVVNFPHIGQSRGRSV